MMWWSCSGFNRVVWNFSGLSAKYFWSSTVLTNLFWSLTYGCIQEDCHVSYHLPLLTYPDRCIFRPPTSSPVRDGLVGLHELTARQWKVFSSGAKLGFVSYHTSGETCSQLQQMEASHRGSNDIGSA